MTLSDFFTKVLKRIKDSSATLDFKSCTICELKTLKIPYLFPVLDVEHINSLGFLNSLGGSIWRAANLDQYDSGIFFNMGNYPVLIAIECKNHENGLSPKEVYDIIDKFPKNAYICLIFCIKSTKFEANTEHKKALSAKIKKEFIDMFLISAPKADNCFTCIHFPNIQKIDKPPKRFVFVFEI